MILLTLYILGFDGMVGQDSYAYADFASAIRTGRASLAHPDDFAWPIGYPLLGAILSFTGWSIPFSLQLISCLSFSGTLIFVKKILKEIYPDSSEGQLLNYILLLGLLSPYYVRSSMLTTPDVLTSCSVIAGIYWIGKYVISGRRMDLLLGTLIFAWAFFVRYVSALLALVSALFVLQRWSRLDRNTKHLLIILIPLVIILMGTLFAGDLKKAFEHGALEFWSITNFFNKTFATDQGYSDYFLPNIVYIFYPFVHYGFTLLGIPLLLITILQRPWKIKFLQIVILSYFAYGFFVAGINAQNTRYLLPLFPLVLILCFYGYTEIVKIPVFVRFKSWIVTLLVITQVLLCAFSFRSIFKRNALEQEMAIVLNNTKQEVDLLYSFDIDIALKSRGIPFRVINLWQKPLDAFEPGALVLFNEEKFARQWKDKNPMINWDMLNEKYHMTMVCEFQNQWKLYRIEDRL
jgi:hypothetical protein